MKILHLIYTQAISGAEKYLKHLLPGLKQEGIECDLIIVCSKKSAAAIKRYSSEMNVLGIKTSVIVTKRFSIVNTAFKVNRYLKANQIHILHSHLLNSDLIASVLKNLFYKKLFLISTKHGYQEKILQQYEPGKSIKLNDLYYHITKYTLRKIDKNVAVSKGMAELFYNLKISKQLFPYIHHGVTVEVSNLKEDVTKYRKANPQLIIVGRIELFKGHHYLIDAMPKVIAHFPSVQLLVLGEGSEKENCIAQAEKLGVLNNIQFLGYQLRPYSYISNSDVIILPSVFEPFGLVYIEAFALKTPVIAFDTAAGNEIMKDGETALLVKKGDSNALADKIIYLLKNEAERKNITERAFAAYQQNYLTEIMVKNMSAWYHSLEI